MKTSKGKKEVKEQTKPQTESANIKSVEELWHSYFPVSAQKKEIENLNPAEIGFLSAQRSMDRVTGLNMASSPIEISGRNAFELSVGKPEKRTYFKG